MTNRSAPRKGYDTPEKQKYRQDVWAALIGGWVDYKHDPLAHVLLLPSSEGLEIDYVVSLGIPQDRVIAIDKSAAVIATSAWRKKYPDVKFMATTIGGCAEKLRKRKINVCAANLDFCSNFSADLIAQFSSFMAKAPLYEYARIGVTVAKGRESTATALLLKRFAKDLQAYTEPRLGALMACADNVPDHHLILAQGAYKSGSYPMAWAVLSQNFVQEAWRTQHLKDLEAIDVVSVAKELKTLHPTAYHQSTLQRRIAQWFNEAIGYPAGDRFDAMMADYTYVGAANLRRGTYEPVAVLCRKVFTAWQNIED